MKRWLWAKPWEWPSTAPGPWFGRVFPTLRHWRRIALSQAGWWQTKRCVRVDIFGRNRFSTCATETVLTFCPVARDLSTVLYDKNGGLAGVFPIVEHPRNPKAAVS